MLPEKASSKNLLAVTWFALGITFPAFRVSQRAGLCASSGQFVRRMHCALHRPRLQYIFPRLKSSSYLPAPSTPSLVSPRSIGSFGSNSTRFSITSVDRGHLAVLGLISGPQHLIRQRNNYNVLRHFSTSRISKMPIVTSVTKLLGIRV